MTNPTISIICPIYNAEEYLPRLIESVLGQTFEDLELICVLDAPTDGSERVVRRYAACDSRVVVVKNKTNLHAGESRNVGLRIARGSYIGFADADDECRPEMYATLYDAAVREQADWVLSRHEYKTEDGSLRSMDMPKVVDGEYIRNELIDCGISHNVEGSRFSYLHNGLYRASLLREKNIWFLDTKRFSPEDSFFNAEVAMHSKRVVYIDKPLYIYYMYSNSICHSDTAYSEGMFTYDKRLRCLEYWYDLLEGCGRLQGYEWRVARTIHIKMSLEQLEEFAPKTYRFFIPRFQRHSALYWALRMSFLRSYVREKSLREYLHKLHLCLYVLKRSYPYFRKLKRTCEQHSA